MRRKFRRQSESSHHSQIPVTEQPQRRKTEARRPRKPTWVKCSRHFAKYFSSRSSACSTSDCCLQKPKRTKVSGVPLWKKADSGISATPASRIRRSQKAKSFSLVSCEISAVKK